MKWEYKVMEIDDVLVSSHIKELEESLNKQGEEGWELTAVLHQNRSGVGWASEIDTDLVIFKKGMEVK